MVGGGCGDPRAQECDGDVVVSRKRNINTVAGGRKRSKRSMMDLLPEELVEKIVKDAVRGHLDVGMLKTVCSTFNKALCCDEIWKMLVARFWGSRTDIIAPPIKRASEDQLWERYYKNRMLTYRATRSYLKKQQLVTVAQRSILVNWVLSVVDESEKKDFSMFVRLQAQHRTVAYFDRYCSTRIHPLVTSELQLLGAGCVVLALQMKDPVQIEDSFYEWVAYYTDGAVTAGMLMETTKDIYRALSVDGPGGLDLVGNAPPFMHATLEPFRVSGFTGADPQRSELWPTCEIFKISRDDDDACLMMMLRLLQKVNKDNEGSSTFYMTLYLAELALQSDVFLKYIGDVIAAAAFVLACHNLCWPSVFWGRPLVDILDEFHLDSEIVYRCIVELWRLFDKSQKIILHSQEKRVNGNENIQIPQMIVKNCKRRCQKVASVLPQSRLPPKWWNNIAFD